MGGTDGHHSSTAGRIEREVLIVEDERDLADLYTTWLESTHEVRTAYSGEEALEKADRDVDLLFLDRQLPDMRGREVLEHVRERGLDCHVVMVTATDPDFDIVEMPFDDYLTKPVMGEDLEAVIENMKEREAYADTVQEYFALRSKKATLEAKTTRAARRESTAYQKLLRRLDELAQEAGAVTTESESPCD